MAPAVDRELNDEAQGFLRSLAAQGRAVLVSTHDVEFAAAATDRMILMADAEIVADGRTREVAVSSPAYAPQVARCVAPRQALTVRSRGFLALGVGGRQVHDSRVMGAFPPSALWPRSVL